MRISLTGDVAITHDDKVVSGAALGGRQVRLALALLVLERHRSVHRDELADLLWRNVPPRSWEVALRGVLRQVRQAFAAVGWSPPDLLTTRAGMYRLRLPADVVVDVDELEGEAAAAEEALARGDRVLALAHAGRAAALRGQSLLPSDEGPWLDAWRGQLQAHAVRALTTLGRAALDSGDPVAAADIAMRLVQVEPYSEAGYRLLVEAHAAAGDRVAANRAYREYTELLAREVGATPSAETEALWRTVTGSSRLARTSPLAGPPADVVRLRNAGGKAMREQNPAAAAVHYAAAAAAAARAGDRQVQASLLIDTGHARKLAGDPAGAEEAVLAGADLARKLGDHSLLGRAAITLAGMERIVPTVMPAPAVLIEEALSGLPPQPTALRAVLLARRAQYLAVDGRFDELEPTSNLAAEIARASGTDQALVDALVARLHLLAGPTRAGERLAVAGEISARTTGASTASTRLLALEKQVHALIELGEWQAATAVMDRYRNDADAAGLPQPQWFASQHRTCRLVVEGRLDECEAEIEEVGRLAERVVPQPFPTYSQVFYRVVPYWLRGELPKLADQCQEIADWLGNPPRSRASLAFVASAAGARTEARRLLRGVVRELPDLPPDMHWAPTIFYLSAACAEAGTRSDAAAIRSHLVGVIGRDASFSGFTYYGAYALMAGALARVCGALDESYAELTMALRHQERIGARPWIVLARRELAATLQASGGHGRVKEIRRLHASADRLAAEIGMPTLSPAR